MLSIRRIISNAVISAHPKFIGNKGTTHSIRFFSKELESAEKSKDLNQLSSEQLNKTDSNADEIAVSKKCNDKFPKTISEASQEVQREFYENTDAELCLTYTCTVCSRRNSKTISRLAYLNGVVIVRCDKCQNTELVADNVKWFDDIDGKKNVEDILAEKGEKAVKVQHVSAHEFFGIKNEAISHDNVEAPNSNTIQTQQSKLKSILLAFIMGKAQIVKQKLSNMLTTERGKK